MAKNCQLILLPLLFVLSLLLSPAASQAGDVTPQIAFARDGNSVIATVYARIPDGYHAYAHTPGDAGRPTTLDFFLADGVPVTVYYPKGSLQRDYYDSSATVNVYDGELNLFMLLPSDSPGKPYRASLSLLMCSSSNCVPVDRSFSGIIPRNIPPIGAMSWAEKWKKAEATGERDSSRETAEAPEEPLFMPPAPEGAPSAGHFRAVPGGGMFPGEPNGLPQIGPHVPLDAENDSPLPPPPEFNIQLQPVYADQSIEIFGLGKALLLGIIAGLILNVMPCVLPVVTLKLSGLLLLSANSKEGIIRFREHNIFFAAGILTLFTVLAIVLGAADLIWGQFYQSQTLILIMLVLIFLMGLSMFGVFDLPMFSLNSLKKAQNPRLESYTTGLLSTILATPCSGPLLGGVLGWAFTQPLPILLVVFWAVGLGMALPYIVLSIFPSLAAILPRPGAWMGTFEKVVGFLLFGTCVYLLSILPDELHVQILIALLITGFAAYLWKCFCGLRAPKSRRLVGSFLFLGIIAGSIYMALTPPTPAPGWKEFNPHEFVSDLGNKPMLVEFTADWCPNCKFLESTVYTEKNMAALKKRYGLTFVRVDLTDANAYGLKLLNLLGSRSIPVAAIFPQGGNASQPMVLRDVFSTSGLREAARKTLTR